jgi:uncharacterized protein (TIGR03083 family)
VIHRRRSIAFVNHEEHCGALAIEVERFASALERADPTLRVPTCPAWSVGELALHLGTVHRWAEQLVARRASERIDSSVMGLDLEPVDAAWLRRGGESLTATLLNADPGDSMWAWGVDQRVGFWSRRQLHETLVHRIDLELAMGEPWDVESVVTLDAIDELFGNLAAAGRFSPRVRELRGDGDLLRFTSTDSLASWTVKLLPDGFTFVVSSEVPHAELYGPAADLLGVLYRRQSLQESDCRIRGRQPLIDFWLSNSALE